LSETKVKLKTISQKHFLSNFLKLASVGLLSIGTISAILIFQESTLGFNAQSIFPIFALTYFFGVTVLLFRPLFMSNTDWIILHFENFRNTKKDSSLQRALETYNRSLGSCLSLRKLLAITQNVTESYKIGSTVQKSELDEKISKIIDGVKAKDLPNIDSNLISLALISKEMTKQHKAVLGFSVKYPLRFLAWEQTKISFFKNYPKLMYLLLGIVI